MTDVKDAPDRRLAKPVWDQNGQARDEARPAGTSGWLRGIIGEDRLIYAGVSAVAIVIGVVGALSTADDIARRGGVYDPGTPLLWDMTSIAVIILLTPALLAKAFRGELVPQDPNDEPADALLARLRGGVAKGEGRARERRQRTQGDAGLAPTPGTA